MVGNMFRDLTTEYAIMISVILIHFMTPGPPRPIPNKTWPVYGSCFSFHARPGSGRRTASPMSISLFRTSLNVLTVPRGNYCSTPSKKTLKYWLLILEIKIDCLRLLKRHWDHAIVSVLSPQRFLATGTGRVATRPTYTCSKESPANYRFFVVKISMNAQNAYWDVICSGNEQKGFREGAGRRVKVYLKSI
jgi:hypothetical protein